MKHAANSAQPVHTLEPGATATTKAAWLDYCLRPPKWKRSVSIGWVALLLILVWAMDLITGPYLSMRAFYETPVALAVIWIGRWAGVIACTTAVLMLFSDGWIEYAEYAQSPQVYWNLPMAFFSYLILALVVEAFVKLHRELEQRVQERTVALRRESDARARLQRELLAASERERNNIGQELHDGLCQHLVGTALAAHVLAQRLEAGAKPSIADARGVVRLVEEGITQTRHLARGLLLASIQPERLIPELEELATTIQRQHAVTCRFVAQGDPSTNDVIASNLYRIAQEAVRNAVRHARPRLVEITLTTADGQLVLSVADDGPGLAPTRDSKGMGLRIMAHRARIIGGSFNISSGAHGGTCVRCQVPVGSRPPF